MTASPNLTGAGARGLQLFALFALAVGQPLLDLLARNAPFLVAHRATTGDILGLVAALLVGLPGSIWLLEQAIARVNPRLGSAVHLGWVGSLVAAAALPVLKRVPDVPGVLLLAVALGLGMVAGFGFAHWHRLRVLVTSLAFAPFVFAGVFATNPFIEKLLVSHDGNVVLDVAIDSDTPVIVVILDELPTTSLLDRTGGIDPIRYPSFARLARRATWFRRASGVHALTEHAIPAILTGRYPDPNLLPTASDHRQNLFTLLQGSYEMNVVELFTALFQPRDEEKPGQGVARIASMSADLAVVYLHLLLPDELSVALPSVEQGWRDFLRAPRLRQKADRTGAFSDRPTRFREFVASIETRSEPTLHFLHIPLPHVPWQYMPSGRLYYPPNDFEFWDNVWGPREWWVVQGYQRHLLQLALVDTLLGELLDRIEDIGLYEPALLIVAADHGASFRANQSRRDPATMEHPEDVLAVPLFVKRPFQREGGVDLRNVETIDILPTIADLIGVQIPWTIDGCSMFDPDCAPRFHKTMYSRDDVRMSFDPAILDRPESLERKLELFGSGSRENGLFAIGPHRDLIGRRIDEIEIRGSANVRVELMQRAFERAQQRPDRFVLSRITGILDRNPTPEELPYVVIAVEGVIQAVAPAFSGRKGTHFFSAMLPEDATRDLRDRVELFALETSPSGPVLQRLTVFLGPLKPGRGTLASAQRGSG